MDVHTPCPVCFGTERVDRLEKIGPGLSKVDTVTCPLCVRGVTVLGPHETLRGDRIYHPGETLPKDNNAER